MRRGFMLLPPRRHMNVLLALFANKVSLLATPVIHITLDAATPRRHAFAVCLAALCVVVLRFTMLRYMLPRCFTLHMPLPLR